MTNADRTITPYVTRIAPSPTGFAHVGTMRTALFNWLIARASGGRFILRIDDTDIERNNEDAVQPILDGLTWLGLDWDALHRQSERLDEYRKVANNLLDAGLATRADNGAILLKRPDILPDFWVDEIGGAIRISERDLEVIDGLPLMRGGDKIGHPTYNFCSIVDDYLLGVNYICRGVDHIANTAKQLAIWCAINAVAENPVPLPKLAHVGLIFQYGKKMSKRDGAASLLDLRTQGLDPDGVFNFLLRLGWGPAEDNKENAVLTRERAISLFLTGGRMRSAPSGYDAAKLAWFDKRHKTLKRAVA